MRSPQSVLLLAAALTLPGCHTTNHPESSRSPDAAQHALITDLENALAKRLMDDAFDARLSRQAQRRTFLGIHDSDGRWDDAPDWLLKAPEVPGDERAARPDPFADAWRTLVRSVDPEKLSDAMRLDTRVFQYYMEREEARIRYGIDDYPVTQVSGPQSEIPAFLINIHPADSEQDLVNYIARLRAIHPLFDELIRNLRQRARAGVVPPRFAFPEIIATSRNVIRGRPFTNGDEDSPLLADFSEKSRRVDLTPARRDELIAAAGTALTESVGPAYEALIACLAELETRTSDAQGVSNLPDRAAAYAEALETATSTNLTPDRIHEIGLGEVSRIHGEMVAAMQETGFVGTLRQFFDFLRTDPRFYFADSPAGRQAYLDLAVDLLAGMNQRLDRLVIGRPDADLIVKAVEPFREATAPAAFYEAPAPDGSRPGIFHVNLGEMRALPTWTLESLIYHEGVPGLHLAMSRTVTSKALPRFRRFERIPAWAEGWALYMESVPKEIGFYRDPYSDFGRLASEARHAAQLVVDTGIHARNWSREQAARYLDDNAPGSHEQHLREVEREIVAPGQATAATIGMLKIRELRRRAEEHLGAAFDLRTFHEWILTGGPLPLPLLEEEIDRRLALASTDRTG